MSQRKYIHIKIFEPEITKMKESGKTKREIAEHFGLTIEQVELLKRYRRRERKIAAGIMPRPKERPRKDASPRNIEAKQACEISRLKIKKVNAGFSAVRRKEVKLLVKYHIIYLNRERYSITAMCRFFEVSRSGYYNFVHRIGKTAHDYELAELIRAQQKKCDLTYDYRRMWK